MKELTSKQLTFRIVGVFVFVFLVLGIVYFTLQRDGLQFGPDEPPRPLLGLQVDCPDIYIDTIFIAQGDYSSTEDEAAESAYSNAADFMDGQCMSISPNCEVGLIGDIEESCGYNPSLNQYFCNFQIDGWACDPKTQGQSALAQRY